jgi:hypothetical protein
MATDKGLDFFYDAQIRRYLLQFIRIFTAFQYQTGRDANGNTKLRQVPAHYAYRDRMVSHILRNNSENVILSTPFITGWVRDLSLARNRAQNPNFVGKVQVYERDIDENTGKYTGELGDTYTVQRYMPVPYDLTMQVDIWTTNEQQKHQLMEQILVLFNPALEIQSSTNPLDWTALTYVELTDVVWSSRSVPIGTEEEIEVASLTFSVPIWINPAAKVQRQNIINVIRTNLYNSLACDPGDIPLTSGDEGDLGQIVTRGWNVLLEQMDEDFEVTLLDEFSSETDTEGRLYDWHVDIFGPYGELRPGATQLRLITTKDIDAVEKDIVGTLQPIPGVPNKLVWNPDPLTLPPNTLDTIDGIIDPHSVWPGESLPNAAAGQRYLVLEEVGGGTVAWGSLTANANDIIMYDGATWTVAFDSSSETDTQYVLNSHTNKQLKWNGTEWVFTIDGLYREGEFRIQL